MTDPLRADVQAVMEAVRRDATCDVQPGHRVGLIFDGADIKQAAEQACYAFAERLLAALVEAFAENEPIWTWYDRIESDLEAVRKLREPA